MKTQKHFLLSMLLVSYYLSAFGQADISMTTHWYNRANYNPAFIARTDYLYLFTNVRKQWVGIDGAPTVMNLQASEYIHSMRSAFGVSLISDQIGITNVLNPSVQYAYRIAPNSEEWALSLGLSAGLFARTLNGSLLNPMNLNDPALVYDNRTIYRPDSNFGVEFQGRYLCIGLSLTHLFAIGKSDNTFENTSHRYGYVIYKNTNSDYFNFSAGIELVNRLNLTTIEANSMIRFKQPTGLQAGPRELFDVGFSVISSKQAALILGYNITSNFRIGYSYEYDYNLRSNQNGTHEIVLEYRIQTKASSTCNSCMVDPNWYF